MGKEFVLSTLGRLTLKKSSLVLKWFGGAPQTGIEEPLR
jgi:hypothetical protein